MLITSLLLLLNGKKADIFISASIVTLFSAVNRVLTRRGLIKCHCCLLRLNSCLFRRNKSIIGSYKADTELEGGDYGSRSAFIDSDYWLPLGFNSSWLLDGETPSGERF